MNVPDELVEALARRNYTTRHPHWDELTHVEKGPKLDAARRELESMARFKMEPGSAEARGEGCICDPPEGNPIVVEKHCPIHGLAELKAIAT